MKCPFCSAENLDDAKFCNSCGRIMMMEKVPAVPISAGGFDAEARSAIFLAFGAFAFMGGFMLIFLGIFLSFLLMLASIALFIIGGLLFVARHYVIKAYERKIEEMQRELEAKMQQKMVKIKCRYCGGLNEQTAQRCAFCSAPL